MFISRKDYDSALLREYQKGWGDGLLVGKEEILRIIRDSQKITIVHGDLKVTGKGTKFSGATVFVIPSPPVGIRIEDASGVEVSNNMVTSLGGK